MALLAGSFFLDDPSDGVSTTVLADIGVRIEEERSAKPTDESDESGNLAGRKRARDASETAANTIPPSASSALPCSSVQLQLEHSFSAAVTYRVSGGGAVFDFRDAAGAWVRVVLHDAALLHVRPGVFARVAPPGSSIYPAQLLTDAAALEQAARLVTTFVPRPVQAPACWGDVSVHSAEANPADCSLTTRFAPGSEAERAANVPHFAQPGELHTREIVVDLCASFYTLGWVTGTGGSISIRHGARTFMAPSGVQKERMQRQDIFVLDASGAPLYAPQPLPGKPRLKLSQCAPLFHHAFTLRGAGACSE